jgi:hypothetical protein
MDILISTYILWVFGVFGARSTPVNAPLLPTIPWKVMGRCVLAVFLAIAIAAVMMRNPWAGRVCIAALGLYWLLRRVQAR